MKNFKIVLFIIACNISLYSQVIENKDVVGIWQFNNKNIAAGWLDNYQFFSNGKFLFNTNQNDSTKRIISIGGTYKIKDSLLTLQSTFSKEIQGGYLVRSNTAGGSGWEIKGGKVIVIKYKYKKISSLKIEKCLNKEDIPCILIDKRIHFKLDDDPSNYH